MMKKYHFGWSVLTTLLIIFNSVGIAEIVTGPRSTTIQVGSSAYFNCSTSLSDEIHWFHYAVGANERTFVYGYDKFYIPYKGRFKMEKNETDYNLILLSAKFEDAGKYECQDNKGGGDKKSAQLTILEQGPICQSDRKIDNIIGPNSCGIEPDVLVLTCTIQYRGNEVPILEWRNLVTNDVISKGITVENKDNYATLNLTMKGDPSIDDTSYLCQTSISTSSPYSCNIGPVEVVGKSDTTCYPLVIAIICIVVGFCVIFCGVVIWYMVTRHLKAEKTKRGTDQERTQEESIPLHNIKEKARADKVELAKSDKPPKDKKLDPYTEQLQTDKRRLEEETQQLLVKLRETEQRLYNSDIEQISYLEKPKLFQTIEIKVANGEKKVICGIAILNPNLFVVFENSQEIEVYDSVTYSTQPKCLIVKEMTHPLDIASSKANECFYVYTIGSVIDETESKILKIDPTGNVIDKWSTDGGPGRLSTSESNVIACLSEKNQIHEYSGTGELLRRIPLSPASKINRPWHAIKVTSMHYIVSHDGVGDDSHRVCLVDHEGKDIKDYPNSTVKLKAPIYLAENSDKCIIVADRGNKQILLMSYMLKFKRKLLSEKYGLKDHPVRLAFDDSGNLFIAENRLDLQKKEWQGGRISIFGIKE